MRQYNLFLGAFLFSIMLTAQPKGELSLLLGGSAYTGDFTPAESLPDYSAYQFAPGLRYSVPLGYHWQLRTGVQYAQYEGDDANSETPARRRRDFSFEGSLFEASTQLVWEPFAKRRYPEEGGYKGIVSPYLFGGIGLAFFERTTRYGIPGVDGFPTAIQQDIDADESPALTLPFGGGIRVDLSKSLSLGVELGVHKTFTDQLDGVSNSGKSDTDDWFAIGGITLSYRWSVPDYDRDGFLDHLDECPERAGVDYAGGCPDSDGDGLADNIDTCPYQAGKLAAKGCPDSDFDNVPDFIDECPDYPGSAAAKGCLDSDGDGLKDDADMCPLCPARDGISGCPDADEDGVEDARDRCPNLPGIPGGEGCPYLDADQDGVADEDDNCPAIAGMKHLGGCPDTDADGLVDAEDKCPELAGTKANGGCPAVSEDVKKALAFVAEAVQFESGSDQLKANSREQLDELVQIMQKYPYYDLHISGHTDSRGNDKANLELSEMRAKACFTYLVSKGVNGDRMQHDGYGESQPIATNKTAEGRRKNRRVVFDLFVAAFSVKPDTQR